MNKFVKKVLHLFVIMAITSVFGILTSIGVSATVGDTFVRNNENGFPITYEITSDVFQTVEIVECMERNYLSPVILRDTVVNPENNLEYIVTSVGYGAFFGCENISSVVLPDSVTTIEYGAFLDCVNITFITMPNSLTSIGDNAFCGCESLSRINIPGNVTTIGNYAFYDCKSLSEITCYGLYPPELGDNAFKKCPSNLIIFIPYGSGYDYVNAGWPEFNLC